MLPRPLLLVSAALAVLTASCHERPKAPQPPAVPVIAERVTVSARMVDDLKPVMAVITTRNQGLAMARISGTLVSLTIREGDQVRKGQVIALIRDDRIGLQTGAYRAQTAAAAAEAARAEADLKRITTLYNSGIYAKARLEQAQAAAKAANANVAAARAQTAASAELGNQGAVLAPADGRVLKASVPVGTVVMAGQTVAEITAGQPVARIQLPEAQARSLKLGDAVRLEADSGMASQGSVAEIYPTVTDGQITADIRAPGLSETLVGQHIRAWIRIGTRKAIILPKRLIRSQYGIDYASLLLTDGRTSDVAIQTAPYGGPDDVEVLSGLTNGDVAVTIGAAK